MGLSRVFAGCALGITLLVPVIASAQSVQDVEAQIRALIAQIQQIQGAASSTTSITVQNVPVPSTSNQTPIICPSLLRNLSLGATGTDVANLQGFLAQNPLIYPEGSVTAYFGTLTQDAVQRWQTAYGIVTSGTPATTGYGVVGPKTRTAIQASCQGQSGQSGQIIIPPSGISSNSCPASIPPTTPCPGGAWQTTLNAQGCTAGWQCTYSLPGITWSSTTSASTASGTTSSSTCPQYTLPVCQNGTQWLGMSSDGCNLGYQCVQH